MTRFRVIRRHINITMAITQDKMAVRGNFLLTTILWDINTDVIDVGVYWDLKSTYRGTQTESFF